MVVTGGINQRKRAGALFEVLSKLVQHSSRGEQINRTTDSKTGKRMQQKVVAVVGMKWEASSSTERRNERSNKLMDFRDVGRG